MNENLNWVNVNVAGAAVKVMTAEEVEDEQESLYYDYLRRCHRFLLTAGLSLSPPPPDPEDSRSDGRYLLHVTSEFDFNTDDDGPAPDVIVGENS